MALYHFHCKIGSRSKGQSAVASASYRSGDKLHSDDLNKNFNYSRKQAIIYSNILLPENAPLEYANREVLWNSVESAEKQQNSQLFREYEISLPNELKIDEKIALANTFAEKLANMGMCVDYSIHDIKKGQYTKRGRANNDNAHIHFLCTVRKIDSNGKFLPKRKRGYKLDPAGNKIPILDKNGKQKVEKKTGRKMWEREDIRTDNWGEKDTLVELRQYWQDICNDVLEKYDTKIDCRTLEKQYQDLLREYSELEKLIIQREKEQKEGELNERLQRIIGKRKSIENVGRIGGGEGATHKTNIRTTTDDRIGTTTTIESTVTTRELIEREERLNRLIERRKQEVIERSRGREDAERKQQETERGNTNIENASRLTEQNKRQISKPNKRPSGKNNGGR